MEPAVYIRDYLFNKVADLRGTEFLVLSRCPEGAIRCHDPGWTNIQWGWRLQGSCWLGLTSLTPSAAVGKFALLGCYKFLSGANQACHQHIENNTLLKVILDGEKKKTVVFVVCKNFLPIPIFSFFNLVQVPVLSGILFDSFSPACEKQFRKGSISPPPSELECFLRAPLGPKGKHVPAKVCCAFRSTRSKRTEGWSAPL